MSYLDICIIGWNLNALMFVVNLLIAVRVISSQDRETLQEESLVLKDLKEEMDKYYPNRLYSTLTTYIVPFAAFFKMFYRLLEMYSFFQKNKNTKMFHYMVYKYTADINKAKNK